MSTGAQSRGVCLLARHWDWLALQSRSTSATLRLLVEDARRDRDGRYRRRDAQEACYWFMRDKAGDRPYFEEAVRALFAGDATRFHELIGHWPMDIRKQAARLASPLWARGAVEEKP